MFDKINDSPGREVHKTNIEKESLSVLEVGAVNFHSRGKARYRWLMYPHYKQEN